MSCALEHLAVQQRPGERVEQVAVAADEAEGDALGLEGELLLLLVARCAG